ncbi:MAG: PilZ domain-containing protein [Candidatus Aminicenantes bacterium]|nr:PilZ domain-containing protein [Candidatus Aminicenantes bacterium]
MNPPFECTLAVPSTRPRALIVDGRPGRLAAFLSTMNGCAEVFPARSAMEAFYWAEKLGSLDCLILHDPAALTAAPLDFIRMLLAALKKTDRMIKLIVAGPEEAEALKNSILVGAEDIILQGPVEIEDFVLEVRRLIARLAREKRSLLRVPMSEERPVRVEIGGADGPAVLRDLSETGMFLQTAARLEIGTARPFLLRISDDEVCRVEGIVVRSEKGEGGIGIAFRPTDDEARKRIFARLAEAVSPKDLAELKRRYPKLNTSEMVAFPSFEKILELLEEARRVKTEITALPAHARKPATLTLERIDPGRTCLLTGKDLGVRFKTGDSVFMSFQFGYATYNFETTVRRIDDDGTRLECFFPRILFYSEKRSLKREAPLSGLRLELVLPPPFQAEITGPIVDVSDTGASFLADGGSLALLPGTPVGPIRIYDNGRLVREEKGEVRNVVRVGDNGCSGYRYGLQFGIGRLSLQTIHPHRRSTDAPAAADEAAALSDPGLPAALKALSHRPPTVVRLENGRGEEIVGLLNSSAPLDEEPVPVVLIPPAFGKTKETLFGLALTLVENFHRAGRPLAVFRYDGIRRKGESHKDPEASEPPLEMANASLSQGADDIRAVLDWLAANPTLKAGPVILVTFSLSALEARIALRDEALRRRVQYWIACMGTLEFRDLMNKVNCGLDLLEQHQLGIDLGIIPILGNLVRMRHYAADVVASGVATLDQAREDMRRINLPITWIYGKHDNWVKAEFVRDVMSIKADAPREVLSVPLGHNARTSEEALRLFGTITSLAHRFLHGTMIETVIPDSQNLEYMRRAEKDRLPARNLKNKKSYWTQYLVGKNDLLGFDTMALSDDYRGLMEDQRTALELMPKDRFLDLGGGTGNFVEHLIRAGDKFPARAVLADLIPEALERACRKLTARAPFLKEEGRLKAIVLDAEMNRFIPVRRFLAGEIGRFEELADQVENLSLPSAVRIDGAYSPDLHRILRGRDVTAEKERRLKGEFELAEYRMIRDFNLAARHVLRLAPGRPVFRKLSFPGGLEAPEHLPFADGSFSKVLMSLVLSYLFNPVETLREVHRIIAPGGRLVVSSMRPDTDASGLFTRLLDKVESMPESAFPAPWPKARLLDSMRSFLNDAQALVDLEEAGTFDFFDPDKLAALLETSGFESVRTIPSFGNPPQGYIIVAKPRDVHG